MVVIGASVVGMEFASVFSALGTKVTVVGRKSFLKDADPQLAKRFRSLAKRSGMSITIGLEFKQIVQTDNGKLLVQWERRDKEAEAEGDLVLLSTGRWPETDGLELDATGITMAGRSIQVNEYLETSLPGVYSIGDVSSQYQLAHVASYEGELAVQSALGERTVTDYRAVPSCNRSARMPP